MTLDQVFLAALGVIAVHALMVLMHRATGGRS